MFQKILVAIDEFHFGEEVFKHALTLAQAMNSRLLLVHALNPTDKDYPEASIYPAFDAIYPTLYDEALKLWQEKLADYEQHRQGMLQSLASQAESSGVTAEVTLNIGDPGRIICMVARTWSADLIVMGRRGRAGISELVLGSVSNYVIHHAPCSVLTVQSRVERSPAPAQQEFTTAPEP